MIDFKAARDQLIGQLSSNIKDKRVLAAMSNIPRELFVPLECRNWAYEDRPLPIGSEQTISQPYIIACMTQALELTGMEKVLEIGTGSGYQTAILSVLARKVVSIERIPALLDSARKTLDDLDYKNIEFHVAGETLGWEQDAPYNTIMVTAGAPEIPSELLSQLAYGGRIVIPVGSRYVQQLIKVTKYENGNIVKYLGGCRFVSLIGKNAWEK
jgi:protein-L-isoaspartate(D-aspartate) O-methyltransferase